MRVAWVALIAGCGFVAQPLQDNGAASAPDGAAFDYASCPPSYTAPVAGPSRYRLIPDGHPAWTQSDDCADDMPGFTHLAVLDSADELGRVSTMVNNPALVLAGTAIWVGIVQQRTATQPDQGWIRFDGAAMTSDWHMGEPNDAGGGEADHREQFVKLQRGRTYFTDSSGSDSNGALCECDGRPIAQVALDAIGANRPPGS
ncbi:MAG TPA: hypothetical protein VGD37_10750 [Kofleriaceae bacterium]|jgi:hypothetical protein